MRRPILLALVCACGGRTGLGGHIAADASAGAEGGTGADLVLWLDDQSATTSSGLIWIDKTAYHHDATQPLSVSQAAIAPNGKGMIFDGVNDYFTLAPGWEDFTAGMTAFVVAYPEHTTPLHAPRFFDFSRGLGTLTDAIIFCRFGAGDELFYQTYEGSTPGPGVDAPGTVVDGEWQELSFTAAGGAPFASVDASVYRNGGLVLAAQTLVPDVVSRTSNLIARSNRTDGVDSFFKGTIGEIRIYRGRLSDSDRQAIDAELAKKWSL